MGMFSVSGGGEGLTPRPELQPEPRPKAPAGPYVPMTDEFYDRLHGPGASDRMRALVTDMLARARPIPGLDRPAK